MHILVVDDQVSIRASLSMRLVHLGHQVSEASNAREALKLYLQQRPDLILLDVILPEEDGYWLARQIREQEGSGWTPIIFLSGQDHDLDLWHGIEAGGDDYLIKPVSEVVLRSKILAMQRLVSIREKLIAATEELRLANERLMHISNHDELTTLGNRRGFNETLHTQIALARRAQQPLTLILCDVDFFKRYNDSLGHVEGDFCLNKLATLLRTTCRRPGDYPARYGGEEFGLVLPNTPKSGALIFAKAVQHIIHTNPIPHPDSPISNHITLSGGITTCIPNKETTVQSMLLRADEALYLAKAKGRNRFFSFEMQIDSTSKI